MTVVCDPWIAERAWQARPFRTLSSLKRALIEAVRNSAHAEKLALIRAHPELAGKAMLAKTLTAESTQEQDKAGLTQCTAEEFALIHSLNARYNERFGFPFILAVRGPRGSGLGKRAIREARMGVRSRMSTSASVSCRRFASSGVPPARSMSRAT